MFHEAIQKIKVARFLWTTVYVRSGPSVVQLFVFSRCSTASGQVGILLFLHAHCC